MDCLLIHPALRCKGETHFPVMPMGMFPMADYLSRLGFKTGILNTAVEYIADPEFDLSKYIRTHRPNVVAIGLHWYVHSYSAIETARLVRQADSDAIIVLGGYTASFFDAEIAERFDFIDAVIRGEGEAPLAALMRSPDKTSLEKLPNHTVAKNGAAVRSEEFIFADSEILDSLNFSNLDYLEHSDIYTRNCSHSSTISYINTKNPIENLFYISTGRGCGNNCSYCGGSNTNYRRLTGRSKPYIRPAEKVAAEMIELMDRGISAFYFEYDPLPDTQDYYIELFELARRSGKKPGANFSTWGLTGDKFLDAFAATFDMERSCLCFVPKSGSQKVRDINKSNTYTNAELTRVVKAACERGIYPSINYKIGQPGETMREFRETVRFANSLRKLPVIQSVSLLPTDPGSPMFVEPEKYGATLFRKTFTDFYNAYRDHAADIVPAHPLGYETSEFSERQLLALKMKAYRAFYFRPSYILNRKSKSGGSGRLFKYAKIFISILLGLPSLSIREEKS